MRRGAKECVSEKRYKSETKICKRKRNRKDELQAICKRENNAREVRREGTVGIQKGRGAKEDL